MFFNKELLVDEDVFRRVLLVDEIVSLAFSSQIKVFVEDRSLQMKVFPEYYPSRI